MGMADKVSWQLARTIDMHFLSAAHAHGSEECAYLFSGHEEVVVDIFAVPATSYGNPKSVVWARALPTSDCCTTKLVSVQCPFDLVFVEPDGADAVFQLLHPGKTLMLSTHLANTMRTTTGAGENFES